MMKFTLPRLWKGGCAQRSIVIINVLMVFLLKAVNVFVPLILREVIDSIICEEEKLEAGETFLLRGGEGGCPSENETYLIIGIYALVRFGADFLTYIREVPYANMAAVAEISIAHDVYDHVQRQCLAFHLSRETGKIIRIVSRGSQQFSQILRMLWFNLAPMLVEVTMVLVIFGTLFSYQFLLVQLGAIVLYVGVTYNITEWRASKFRAQTQADQNYN